MLSCSVVRDLLPSYLEGLTAEETNREIEEHLDGCDECRGVKIAMSAEMGLETAVPLKKDLLKKIGRYQVLGILLILGIFFFIVWISTVYHTRYDLMDMAKLEQQLERFGQDTTVLTVEKLWNRAYVLYAREDENEFGLLELQLHVDGTYGGISDTRLQGEIYAAFPLEIGRLNYVLVCGIQTLPDVSAIQISGVTKDGVENAYKGAAFEGPFIKIIPVKTDHRDLKIYYYGEMNHYRTEDEILIELLELDPEDPMLKYRLSEHRLRPSSGMNWYTKASNHIDGVFLDNTLYDQLLIIGIAVVLWYIRVILDLGSYHRCWNWIPMGAFVGLSALVGNDNLLFALIVLSIRQGWNQISRKKKSRMAKEKRSIL